MTHLEHLVWFLLAMLVVPWSLPLTQGTGWTLVNASSGYSMEAGGDVLMTEGASVLFTFPVPSDATEIVVGLALRGRPAA
jgi:hypothetical protein